jgi:glycosyltransferase involved in cell wall biosynthesis
MLYILIPSYNRADQAIDTILSLVSGSAEPSDYHITVIDNASSCSYSEYFLNYPFLKSLIERKVLSIVTNNANVGMGANIVKCFEHVVNKAGWLWIVSDDDDIHPEAILNVQAHTKHQHPSVSFLKFSSPTVSHPADLCFDSPSVLVDYISFDPRRLCNSYLLLSNIIYRIDFQSELCFLYESVHTYSPHLISIFNRLGPDRRMAHSPAMLVSYKVPAVGYSYGRICGLGVSGLKHPLISELNLAKFNYIFQVHDDFKVLLDLRFETLAKSISSASYLFIAISYCIALLRSGCLLRSFLSFFLSLFLFNKAASLLSARVLKRTRFRSHIDEISRRYSS